MPCNARWMPAVTRLVAGIGLTLSGCAPSGSLPLPPDELRACFEAQVGPPPPGVLSRDALYAKLAELKRDVDTKSACGRRLICLYDEMARKLDPERQRPPLSFCVIAPA